MGWGGRKNRVSVGLLIDRQRSLMLIEKCRQEVGSRRGLRDHRLSKEVGHRSLKDRRRNLGCRLFITRSIDPSVIFT